MKGIIWPLLFLTKLWEHSWCVPHMALRASPGLCRVWWIIKEPFKTNTLCTAARVYARWWNPRPPVQCLHSETIWPAPRISSVTDRRCAPRPEVGKHPFRWRHERKGNTFLLRIFVQSPLPASAFILCPEAGVVALPCDCTLHWLDISPWCFATCTEILCHFKSSVCFCVIQPRALGF